MGLVVAKAIRNFHCDFHDAPCEDSRCKRGTCVPEKEGEEAFRQHLPSPAAAPEDREWSRAFKKERRAVIRLVCRLNKVKYSAALGKKYLNDHRVVTEAIRRMGQRSKL
jgi:hypothetical protein